MKVPRTIWLAWCHTCKTWLDETESAEWSARLVLDEHPNHLMRDLQREEGDKLCRVEVIPFRADRGSARRVVAHASAGVKLSTAIKDGSATVVCLKAKKTKKGTR